MRVDVSMLGGFVVVVDGRAVDPERWGGERGRALVKLLALSRGHRLHREQVIDALWPELSLRAAAPRLHKATHMARRALGDQTAVATSEGTLALWPSAEVIVDVERFESLAMDVRTMSGDVAVAEALEVYRGDLLPDDLYEPWTDVARQRLRERHRELLRVAERWDALLAIDATDETAHLALAQLAVDAGDRVARCAGWTSWTGCSTRSSACRRATPPSVSGMSPRRCRSRCRCSIADRQGLGAGCRHR